MSEHFPMSDECGYDPAMHDTPPKQRKYTGFPGEVPERIGVLGYGQIGRAVCVLAQDATPTTVDSFPAVYDPKVREFATDRAIAAINACHIVHVCIPGDKLDEIGKQDYDFDEPPYFDPLLIVHSTTPIGACRELADRGWRVVHAPVSGPHPLHEALRAFTMPLTGAPDDVRTAYAHLHSLSIPVEVWGENHETTEIAKLADTLRLGVDIAFMRMVMRLVKHFGGTPDDANLAYQAWTQNYNAGYKKMGRADLARPIFTPTPGKLGGHCVGPNAKLLEAQHTHPLVRAVVALITDDFQP